MVWKSITTSRSQSMAVVDIKLQTDRSKIPHFFFCSHKDMSNLIQVTMFAYANDKVRLLSRGSRGLRAPCRKAPPRCFS